VPASWALGAGHLGPSESGCLGGTLMHAMKKLFILQALACAVLWLVGSQVGLDLWQIALFAWVPVFIAGYAWFWWFRNIFFYRDPDRSIPEGDDLILAPADGRIMYHRRVAAGEVVSDKAGRKIPIAELAKTDIGDTQGWLVGIYMTPFDVHYNRAPIGGEIKTIHHHRTSANLPMVDLWEYLNFTLLRKAVDLFAAPFHLENERLTMQIQNGRIRCILILIADQFVNKITRFFEDAQEVHKGDKISFIARGSQTDLFIPCERLSFKAQPGDQVYAGETVLATIER
jgi:phosphatidylserine decarboxylase